MYRYTLAVGLWLASGVWLLAAPVVEDVRAAQIEGTKLVRIQYDLVGNPGETADVSVAVEVAGQPIVAVSFAGAVGEDIAVGDDHEVIWDMEADWNHNYSADVVFIVHAESPPPVVPEDMILMPAGTFTMGDSFPGASGEELPLREITLSAFFIGKYEISRGVWDEVAAWAISPDRGDNAYAFGTVGASKGATHPVQSVHWRDAVRWCNARSEKEGLTPVYRVGGQIFRTGSPSDLDDIVCDWSANGYRLPTEAEWEAAGRGGVAGQRFPGGDTLSHAAANYRAGSFAYDTTGYLGLHPTYEVGVQPYTAPVGSFAPTGGGLYDMAGNVGEFCWDWFDDYPEGPATNPRGPASAPHATTKVVRGGTWTNATNWSRVSARMQRVGGGALNTIGFRVVRRVP